MPLEHRLDYRIMEKESRKEGEFGSPHRDAYLYSYVNIEDLVQGKSLLIFLHSRGHNLPEAFANSDLVAAHLGIVRQAIIRPFLNEYTMFLHGRTTPETYGQIVAWTADSEAFECMIDGRGKQPGEGLLIMEIQKKVLEFLVKCCHSILGDMSPEGLTGKNVPLEADPGPVLTDPTAWPSLAAMSAEAPYRVPASVDFQRLEAIIDGKASAAKDHIWALREDPGYFAAFVAELSVHRLERVLDENGRRHPDLDTSRFLDHVIG